MENQAIDVIASLSVGTVAKWVAFIALAVSSVCAITIKAYKAFEKFKEVKDEKEDLETTVHKHDEKIDEIDKKLNIIIGTLESQNETTMKKLRRELVKDGERYLVEKEMTIREWKSWMEMYDEYHFKYMQNSYVETLKNRIEREVTITGRLDEHGNDIE